MHSNTHCFSLSFVVENKAIDRSYGASYQQIITSVELRLTFSAVRNAIEAVSLKSFRIEKKLKRSVKLVARIDEACQFDINTKISFESNTHL